MPKHLLRSVVAAAALVACGPTEPGGHDAAAPSRTFQVRFHVPAERRPAPLEVPFPSDLYLDGATHRVLPSLGSWENLGITRHGETIDGAFAGLDGFGRSVGALFLVESESPIDPASLV